MAAEAAVCSHTTCFPVDTVIKEPQFEHQRPPPPSLSLALNMADKSQLRVFVFLILGTLTLRLHQVLKEVFFRQLQLFKDVSRLCESSRVTVWRSL